LIILNNYYYYYKKNYYYYLAWLAGLRVLWTPEAFPGPNLRFPRKAGLERIRILSSWAGGTVLLLFID
jgi:hypothetical protein